MILVTGSGQRHYNDPPLGEGSQGLGTRRIPRRSARSKGYREMNAQRRA
jgi:hypothetical protein